MSIESELDWQRTELVQSIQSICQRFNLSGIIEKPNKLSGGCIHDMWTLSTETGKFALRKVNKMNYRLLEKTILAEEQAENLALHHQQNGLLTRVALRSSDRRYVEQCQNGYTWMIFPWIEGAIKEPSHITQSDAQSVAQLLINIQTSAPTIKGLALPNWFGFSEQHWESLIQKAHKKNINWASTAQTHKSLLNQWSKKASAVAFLVQKNLIISHRDLSSSNVIWTPDNRPVVIDWEYAGLVNPESEIFNTAMTWAYQPGGRFDSTIFKAFINASKLQFSLNTSTLIAAYAGYILEWCEFNMQRSLIENDSSSIAETQVSSVFQIIRQLSESSEISV